MGEKKGEKKDRGLPSLDGDYVYILVPFVDTSNERTRIEA